MKDRLIQTRVPERLESVLKEEAQKRRLSVSHLIRNMLEDTLHLVDTVVTGAGDLVEGSVDLAEQVKRDAGRIASTARQAARRRPAERPRPDEQRPDEQRPDQLQDEGEVRAKHLEALEHVLAWNEVVVNRPAQCAGCEGELRRGDNAHLGFSDDPKAPPAWLCDDCLEQLRELTELGEL